MRRTFAVTTLAVLCLAVAGLAAGAAAAGAAAPPAAAAPATWTFAIYYNGDNDLWSDWSAYTLRWLKQLPASDRVDVVAVLDRPGHTGTTLLKISGGTVQKLATFPEKDFGSPATLTWFLSLVKRRFPAEHTIVSLSDHGYGWRYISWDDASNDQITMPELQTALERAALPIDVLVFDACNMADIEVADQVARTGLVTYMVASEETVEDDGNPYGIQLSPLVAEPSRSPAQVAADMVRGWYRYYQPLRVYNGVCLSAVDLAKVAALRPDVKAWVTALKAGLPRFRARYAADLRKSQSAWESWHVDLGDLCRTLAADPAIADPHLQSLSQQVADDVAGSVLLMRNGSQRAAFSGLTLWWGTGSDWRTYRADYAAQVAFGRDVGWYAFLKAYNAGSTASAVPQVHYHDRYGLADVSFIDAQRGWAVGYNNRTSLPVILRTVDGGVHWANTSRPAWGNYLFQSLGVLDRDRLWTCGDWGYDDSLIMRSTTGGRSWATQQSGTRRILLAVDFTDARNGWVGGTGGTLLKTADGGVHWKTANAAHAAAGVDDDVWGVDFVDAANGWIVGGDAAARSGFVRHTDDGGRTWTEQATTAGSPLYSIRMASATEGWAVGGDVEDGTAVILHTSDAGTTWLDWPGSAALERRLSDVTVAGTGDVWATGDHGTLLHSIDDGADWLPIDIGSGADLFAASFPTATDGWVVGDCEQLYHTTNSGVSWSSVVADVTGPVTHLRSTAARYGGDLRLRYRVEDDMSATAVVRIIVTQIASWQDGRLVPTVPVRVGTLRLGREPTGVALRRTFSARWRPGRYVMRCLASDAAHNPQSHAARATLTIR